MVKSGSGHYNSIFFISRLTQLSHRFKRMSVHQKIGSISQKPFLMSSSSEMSIDRVCFLKGSKYLVNGSSVQPLFHLLMNAKKKRVKTSTSVVLRAESPSYILFKTFRPRQSRERWSSFENVP